MSNEYPAEIRREARRLWLTGRYTDEEIAAKLGIPRADTIRDRRHQEGWTALARDIAGVIQDEATARVQAHQGAFKTKYDQIGQAMENMAVRAMREPGLSPRDLKAIAGTFALTQRIRDKAASSRPSRSNSRKIGEERRQRTSIRSSGAAEPEPVRPRARWMRPQMIRPPR